MKAIANILGSCMDYIKELARSISESFTGADSGAVLIMIVFYLAVLIILILLLKLLFKVIKGLFGMFKSKKTKSFKQGNTAAVSPSNKTSVDVDSAMSDVPCFSVHPQKPVFSEDFDGQACLDLLKRKFDTVDGIEENAIELQHIIASAPELLVIDGTKNNVTVTQEEREEVSQKVADKSLIDLHRLFESESKEATITADKISILSKSLSNHCNNREKLAEEELLVLDKYNSTVGEWAALKANFDDEKGALSEEYMALFNFVSDIILQKNAVYEQIKEINNNIALIPDKLVCFDNACERLSTTLLAQLVQKEELLSSLKDNYLSVNESRTKKDEEIAGLKNDLNTLVKKKSLSDETIEAVRFKIDELKRLEAERLAREEAERKAREEAERLEAERIAKLEAEKREKERVAREEAERAAKLEAEKRAREEAERLAEEKERRNQEAQKSSEPVIVSQGEESIGDSADAEGSSSQVDVSAVKEQFQKQAKNSYTLNFDDIPPEMYEKIARSAQKRKHDISKAIKVESSPVVEESFEDDVTLSTSQEPQEVDLTVPVSSSVEEAPNDESNSAENASSDEKDYMAVLKEQWAAEKAHKEKWAAERAQKQAEAERRRKELSNNSSVDTNSDTQ